MTYEFRNDKYPQLHVASTAGRVRFVGGVFSTEDKALGEALCDLPDWYGVQLVDAPDEGDQDPPEGGGEGDGDGPEEIKPPARSASKTAWVAYADSQDPADHASMTKDELIAQYGERADG